MRDISNMLFVCQLLFSARSISAAGVEYDLHDVERLNPVAEAARAIQRNDCRFLKAYEYEQPPGIPPERVGEYFNRYGTKVFKHVFDVDWGDPYKALLDEADRWAKIYNEYLYNHLEALQSAGRQVAPGDGRCRSALMTRATGAETGRLRLSLGLGSMK